MFFCDLYEKQNSFYYFLNDKYCVKLKMNIYKSKG